VDPVLVAKSGLLGIPSSYLDRIHYQLITVQ